MIAPGRPALALSLGLVLSSFGCDRSQERAAEEEALRQKPPVETGNIGQAMRAERAAPRLPTPSERLLLAIRTGDRERAKRQLAEGATLDPDTPWLVTAVRGEGDLGFVRWLVARDVGIDTPDSAARTALSWAAGRGLAEESRFLIARGADVASVDQLGRTPLHFAVFSGSDEVVGILLDASADVNAQDSLGTTPLMYACAKNEAGIVTTLRERGADSTLEDKLGRTAAERAHGEDNPCAAP